MSWRDILRTAALALGFVAGVKLASLTGDHRVAGTIIFSALWGLGGALYWAQRPAVASRQVLTVLTAIFDLAMLAIVVVYWHRG